MTPEESLNEGLEQFSEQIEDIDLKPDSAFKKVFFERPSEANDAINLGRTLYELKEFRKCSMVTKPFVNSKHQSAIYLHYLS
jgi:hypothetical protein